MTILKTIHVSALFLLLSITNSLALTYLPEDAERGGMWANTLINASDQYKDGSGNFISDGSWSDAHNLLGPIPESQNGHAPVHSSIVTMNYNEDSWVILGFTDEYGNTLQVNNDPTNPGGYDGIVWGNAFYAYGGPGSFSEPGTIYLSQDGNLWWALPAIFDYEPYYYASVSGTHQTFDHTPGNGSGLVSPGAPLEFDGNGTATSTGLAGGDAFDMSTAYFAGNWMDPDDDDPSLTGLEWFSYILVTGQGAKDNAGNAISGGSDCDSIYVFSTSPAPVPVPGTIWLLGSGLAGLSCLRRKFIKQQAVPSCH